MQKGKKFLTGGLLYLSDPFRERRKAQLILLRFNGEKMASVSSPSTWKYDVFVSFRGEDTRRGFVSHLYRELNVAGFTAFKDNVELEKGMSITLEIPNAVQESRLSIVVISKHYAHSKWCLDELLEIMDCEKRIQQKVIPVFYDVYPRDVRYQRNSFKDAFKKHNRALKEHGRALKSIGKTEEAEICCKAKAGQIRKWKEALAQVAEKSGYRSIDWEESELIQNIIEDIERKLNSESQTDSGNLGEINCYKEDMKRSLKLTSKKVRVVGIWGKEGVGKTTLARAVYDEIKSEFNWHCFIDEVGKVSRERSVSSLQEHLLAKTFRKGERKLNDAGPGSNVIKSRLQSKKVLIVLDDVDHKDQLNALAKDTDWFGAGSRIIITTTDRKLLTRHGVKHLCKVKGLPERKLSDFISKGPFKRMMNFSGLRKLRDYAWRFAECFPLTLGETFRFTTRRNRNSRGASADNSSQRNLFPS